MTRIPTLAVAPALLLASLLACDSTDPSRAGPPAAVQIAGGNGQTGTVGVELPNPLVVVVVDDAGHPVPGQAVNFHVTAGQGTMFAGTVTTNAEGTAQDRWTLGTVAGASQAVEARVVNATTGAQLIAAFTATARPGAPATIQKTGGDGLQAAVGTTLTATAPQLRLFDSRGNALAGVAVTFAVASGGGSITGATTITDQNGYAAVGSWTMGSAPGPNTLTAAVASLAPVTFTVTAVPGPPARIVIQQPAAGAGTGAPFAQQPIVRVEDAAGNLVPTGGVVTMSVSAGATIYDQASVSFVDGVARYTKTGLHGPQGTYTLTFTAMFGNDVALTVTQPIVLGVGPAVMYRVTASSSTAPVGTPVTITAQLLDNMNQPVPLAGVTVTWERSSGGQGGTLGSATSQTNASGAATVTYTPTRTGTETVTARDANNRNGTTSVTGTP